MKDTVDIEAPEATEARSDLLVLTDAEAIPALFNDEAAMLNLITQIEDVAKNTYADPTTAKGRKELTSLATKVARTKTTIDKAGLELTRDWRERTTKVNNLRKIVNERLDASKAAVLKPRDDWQAAEDKRIEAHNSKLALFALDRVGANSDVATLEGVIASIEAVDPEALEEFEDIAEENKAEALKHYSGLLDTARAMEQQRAELEQLRKEKAEREAKEAQEAAERAEKEAEEQRRREREEAEAREREDAERRRVEAEQAERDRIEREKVQAVMQMNAHLDNLRQGTIDGRPEATSVLIYAADQIKVRTDLAHADLEALTAKLASVKEHLRQRAETERAEEQRRAAEAKERAEQEAAEELRRRQEAQAERERLAAEKRAADQRHRDRIAHEIGEDIARIGAANLVEALMAGKVRHVTVNL